MNFLFTVSKKKGFAMLFAVLVSSVLLSIGVSIFNLTIKELVLSSAGRESQFAFYAADTGIECGLYWDFKASTPSIMFATSTESGSSPGGWRDSIIDAEDPHCIDTYLKEDFKNPISRDFSNGVTRFKLTIPNTNAQGGSAPYCAIVTVTKDSSSGIMVTTVESRGYNTGCEDTSNPNRIERALVVTY
jgi:Tfp pilus assembly protein PilX